jgi:hypothetical protein
LKRMAPRDIFNQYILPALSDFKNEPAALHRAVSALCHIDALAEEVWSATKLDPNPRRYRETLKSKLIDLAYAWDVHDIHKHGMLNKRIPILPNGRRPDVVLVGCAFQSNMVQSNAFQVGKLEVVLTLHDGTQVRALKVIEACVDWWDSELTRLGWY